MKRPELNEVPLSTITDKPSVIITMSTGQWDRFLQAAYDYGHTLLELDENEHPVRAYRKAPDISENETFETVIEVCGLDPDYVRSILRDRLRQAWKQKPYRHINQDEEKAWWTNGEPVCGHRQGGGSISPQIGTNPKPRWSAFAESAGDFQIKILEATNEAT